MRRTLVHVASALILVALAAAVIIAWKIRSSLPQEDGSIRLPGLAARVVVKSDRLGIPVIEAANRLEAFRVLGFLHARDRLFQMDLARRKSAGRLAELFGERALPLDKQQRAYQVERAAAKILEALPAVERQVLQAYVEGVNGYMASLREWPFEVIALGYRPEPWRPEDSLLVAFGMFQTLTGQERDERMLTVMTQVLPAEVVGFLTPDTDSYTTILLGGHDSPRPPQRIPGQAIAALLQETGDPLLSARVDPDAPIAGSNQWAVSRVKTRDGRAIVANDMHLNLNVPNIWYRAEVHYGTAQLAGVTLPGLPLVVAGSNGAVAWGFTNVDADVVDLIPLETNPAHTLEYRTPEGWAAMTTTVETIQVKGGAAVPIELSSTMWGPVSLDRLLGKPVAVRWTALDPYGVNLGLLNMDEAKNLEQAIAVMNRAGCPNQNVVLADDRGRIAWTYTGFLPKRRGFDGSVSESWADGRIGWDGFVPPEEMPRVLDPPGGFIATANNRTLGKDYPYIVGHNYSHSYRAYRITQQLAQASQVDESDLLNLQLDTESEFFQFYRRLVLDLVGGGRTANDPDLADAARNVEAWNGRLDADSRGIGLLVRYRKSLTQAIFGPLLKRCESADKTFSYAWRELETPLRALLSERLPETLPNRSFSHWDEFLRAILKDTVRQLRTANGVESLDTLTWGQINLVNVRHPFGKTLPWLSPWVDMPQIESPGCTSHCVRVLSGEQGASERFVVSPGHHREGILHMPGGQSGHPLSPHYRDQHEAWVEGQSLPFAAGPAEHTLTFMPADAP